MNKENEKTTINQVDMENDKNIVYVYRYVWICKDNPNLCVKILCGLPFEHKNFMDALINSSEVVKASRVYMHEYDFNKVEEYEIIKKESKKDEEIS